MNEKTPISIRIGFLHEIDKKTGKKISEYLSEE